MPRPKKRKGLSQLTEVMAERIKEMRLDLGLSQPEICSLTKISQPTWSLYETGDATPSLTALVSISKVSGYDVGWLMGLTNTKSELHCSVYDFVKMLSSILCYSYFEAELTEEGKLVITPKRYSHERLLESAWKQAIAFPKEYAHWRPESEEELEKQHREWLKNMRWKYSHIMLTEDRDMLMWNDVGGLKLTKEEYEENPLEFLLHGIPAGDFGKSEKKKKKAEEAKRRKKLEEMDDSYKK